MRCGEEREEATGRHGILTMTFEKKKRELSSSTEERKIIRIFKEFG
jgi:hypothetical protein